MKNKKNHEEETLMEKMNLSPNFRLFTAFKPI